jgi:hypothetical protein
MKSATSTGSYPSLRSLSLTSMGHDGPGDAEQGVGNGEGGFLFVAEAKPAREAAEPDTGAHSAACSLA